MNKHVPRVPHRSAPPAPQPAPLPVACAAAMLLAGAALAPSAAAAPGGGQVTAGNGRIVQGNGTTTITQQSPRLAIDWTSFGIAAGESVRFIQPGPGAIALNRVTGREPSSILGELSANGTVFLLNPNGVLFGRGARVDVGSLVASTLQLSNADFEAGRHAFSGDSAASVVNRGAIQAGAGGKLALIAAKVENAGTLNADGGSVLLAGASAVSLTLADGRPLGYTISRGAAQALAANGGLIVADGGHVVLTAKGLDGLAESVVNASGVVQARTVRQDRGVIELIADPATGVARVEGRLDASAPEAGGVGGTIRVLGDKVGVFDGARLDARGAGGGGQVLVGGNFQGAGPSPNATAAYVAPTAAIDASATTRGDGGDIVVWGTEVANVFGRLKSVGGPQGGAGGRIETSGHVLDTTGIDVEVSSGGLWLLDPYNVTISTGTQTGGGFSGGIWTPSASGSLVNVNSIQTLLNSGSNVTIRTVGAGAQEGNIAINGNIAKTAGGAATLSLVADGRITTNASAGTHRTITSTSGALNVSMSAAATTTASGNSPISLRFLDINANGGNITVTANRASAATAAAVDLSTNVWTTTGAGSIAITGTQAGSGNGIGVWLRSNSFSTAAGSISVNGTSGGIATVTGTNANGAPLFSTGNIGVYLNGGNTLSSNGGGAITLTGTATGNTATWSGSAVTLGALDALSTAGALTITGTASNPSASTYRNQQSTVALIGSSSNAVTLTGGSVTISGTNTTVGGAASTSNGNAAVKLDGKVDITASTGALHIAGSNAGGDGVWGSGTAAVRLSAPAAIPIQISAQALDTVSGYTGFYIGGPATLSVLTLAPLQISAESQVATRRALWNKGGLIVPGALSIATAAGMVADDTTFGGYFHIGGATSMTAAGAGNTVSLVNAGNAFSGAVAVTAADTTLRNSAALTLGASSITGALTVSAPGISQSGAVSVSGASTLNSGSSAIAMANGGNAFGGAMSLTAGNATVAANAPLTFGASTLTGSLTASAPGLLQTGALSVAGTTALNSGASAITLANSGNVFTGAVSLTSGDATISSSTALLLAASTLSGGLSATAPGISQSGVLSIAGPSALNSGSSAITLANGANAFGGAMSLTAGNATVAANAPLTFGASTLTGSLTATAPGLLQTGALSVAGTTTLNSGTSTITLANSGNVFTGAVSLASGDATINSSTPLLLAASTLSGGLSATAPGFSQSGVLSIAGPSALNSGSSAITLTNSANAFGGAMSLNAGNATVAANAPLTFGASTLTGSLTASAPGLLQTGALSVAGTTALNSGASAITLANSGNVFTGAVSLASGDATINSSTPLLLAASTLSGGLTATAPGISQSGILSIAGPSALNSGSSAITLVNGGNAFGGAMSLTGGDATVAANAPLTFGASTLTGSLIASAPGLLQTGALSVAGPSTLDSGTSAVTLANVGNTFGGALSLTGGDATIVAHTPLTFAASRLSGSLTASAPGLQQTGALSVTGTSTLNSGTSAITLADAGNVFTGAVSLTSGEVLLNTSVPLVFAPSSAGGALRVSAPGIQQVGAVSVTGPATLDAGGADIALPRPDNHFGGTLTLTAADASVAATGPLVLGASAVSGNLDLTASGVSQLGALVVGGTTTLNAGGAAVLLQDPLNALHTLRVVDAGSLAVVNGQAMTVDGVGATGNVSLTTTSGDLTASGTWRVTGGDLLLSAGAARARGDAAGGDVISTATLSMDPGRLLTVYTGSLDGTGLAGTLAERAPDGSGSFRYGRQAGDAPGATGIGDGSTYVLYRERPSLTVTPTDGANTKVYDGGLSDPGIAYTVAGQRHGDGAAMILTGSLDRAPGQDRGRYAVQPGTLADRLGYLVTVTPGHSYEITPAPLLVSVTNASRLIGRPDPAFSVTYAGLVAGQTAATSDLSGTLRYLTGATASSPPGRYEVSATGLSSRNYDIRYAPGVLTVFPASAGLIATGSEQAASRYLSALADLFWKTRAMTSAPLDHLEPATVGVGRWWTGTLSVETRDPPPESVR